MMPFVVPVAVMEEEELCRVNVNNLALNHPLDLLGLQSQKQCALVEAA